MKLSLSTAAVTALCILEAACGACTPTPTPQPAPPIEISDAAETTPPAAIYQELVSSGCLSPDDSGEGLLGVVDLEFSDAEPPWLTCLAAGGAVGDCETPCQ
jgi:hypothetical protein